MNLSASVPEFDNKVPPAWKERMGFLQVSPRTPTLLPCWTSLTCLDPGRGGDVWWRACGCSVQSFCSTRPGATTTLAEIACRCGFSWLINSCEPSKHARGVWEFWKGGCQADWILGGCLCVCEFVCARVCTVHVSVSLFKNYLVLVYINIVVCASMCWSLSTQGLSKTCKCVKLLLASIYRNLSSRLVETKWGQQLSTDCNPGQRWCFRWANKALL